MTYTDAHTSFHALPADIRARVEARVGKPPRPLSTMQIMAAIGQEIVAERERCASELDESRQAFKLLLEASEQMNLDLIDAKVALSASPVPAASGWRDIASAPKDGTWILVFEPAGNPPYHVARWGEYEPGFNDGDETWVTIAIGPNPDTYEPTPTHWRPLPHPQEKSE